MQRDLCGWLAWLAVTWAVVDIQTGEVSRGRADYGKGDANQRAQDRWIATEQALPGVVVHDLHWSGNTLVYREIARPDRAVQNSAGAHGD